MFNFDASVLNSVVGGQSIVDLQRLNISNLEEASAFVKVYGFDLSHADDDEKLWYYHRRALVLMKEKLKLNLDEAPIAITDRKVLQDLRHLLIWASGQDEHLKKWSCALLRVMHVFVHAENDLFSSFASDIQNQILVPLQDCIYHEGRTGKTFLKKESGSSQPVSMLGFEVKPFKTSSSTVIKLLAKPQALAMNVFDKLGVRFVTRSTVDSFRVVQFLVDNNLISFPHIMPDQSSNNLYPVDLFIQASSELKAQNKKNLTEDEIEIFYKSFLEKNKDSASYLRKENVFSGQDYRFIKFITRKLIRIHHGDAKNSFTFFYPYEIQIMDERAHQQILQGPSEHNAYKQRQIDAASLRIFPEGIPVKAPAEVP